MKIQELRIRNWVEHKGQQRQISSVHSDRTLRLFDGNTTIGCFMIGSINPVTLTEEWLLRFKYKKSKGSNYYENSDLRIHKNTDGSSGYQCYHEYGFLCALDYVHELQNLHFDLYKEELI